MPPKSTSDLLKRPRTRSFGFLDYEGHSWACYLVTARTARNRWCGYLTFRPDTGSRVEVVRTAELFIESTEADIERRARGLGKPLLIGLLASALEVERRPTGAHLRGWVRDALTQERVGSSRDATTEGDLRVQYATYRLDQLTHLVGLIGEDVFGDVVEALLEEESYSFRASDRLQFAMLFAQKLETLLPLPPFEAFATDFQRHEALYRRYHHDLHAADTLQRGLAEGL